MKAKKLLVTALAAGTLAAGLAVPAQAATLYEHANYTGESRGVTWSRHISSLNDRVSSVKLYPGEKRTFFEDQDHRGRHFTTSNSYNYLRSLSGYGLHWGETWDDRITSVS